MDNNNLILIIFAFLTASIAIYFLYSVMLHKDTTKSDNNKLQISTKNILEQVEILYNKKEYALVELLALKYLERVPAHYEVRRYLAKAYYEQKKINNAIKQAIIVLKNNNNLADMRIILGYSYMKKNMIPKSIQEFENAIALGTVDTDILRTLAELYRENVQLFNSIQMYEKLIEYTVLEEEKADIYSILAELNIEVSNNSAAFEAYKSRLLIFPQDIETNKKYTELFIKIKNYKSALEQLNYMLNFVSDSKVLVWVYEKMIEIFINQEEYENAIEASIQLLELPKTDKYKVKRNIANYYLKLNRLSTSIEILEELALLSQHEFEITIQLADSYLHLENFEKSLEKYNILREKATTSELKILNILISELYVIWATKFIENNQFNEAFEKLENAVQYNLINPEIYYYMGLNYYKQKNYSASVENLNTGINYCKEKENLPKYLLLLADCHHQLGNLFEEKKALTDVLKIDEKIPEALYKVGIMYSNQQEVKKAKTMFQKAIASDPNFIDAKFQLALLYEFNNKDKACELYLEILEQDPNNEKTRNALMELQATM